MDNQKIGKLIAQLRNRHGLTQQDLGDKIGVGFRAVSKWERGINLPDIANMTELSKIFGISLDELMAGELKEKEELKSTKKLSPRIKIIISIITALIAIVIVAFIYYNTKTYVYGIKSSNTDYYVEGQVTFRNNKISIIINKLVFIDESLSSQIVSDYEYELKSNNMFLFGYGQTINGDIIEETTTIKEISKGFQINYIDKSAVKMQEFIKNKFTLVIKFTDAKEETIAYEIELELFPDNEKIKD